MYRLVLKAFAIFFKKPVIGCLGKQIQFPVFSKANKLVNLAKGYALLDPVERESNLMNFQVAFMYLYKKRP